MEAWFLQIANCFDKATKQQERKIWQNKELAINSKENIESLLCKVNFVDNYNWKIKIIESLRTKITESYKIKIAKSCCRSSWRAKHAWKQCKECTNNNIMQKMKIETWCEDKRNEKVYDKDETHSNFIVACKKNIPKKKN
jgi:hypothetical protein